MWRPATLYVSMNFTEFSMKTAHAKVEMHRAAAEAPSNILSGIRQPTMNYAR